jgi:hypothetical protein
MMAAALAMAAPAAAASLTVTPSSAASGQTVRVTGDGFAGNNYVTLTDNGVTVTTFIPTDNVGHIQYDYTVPPNSNVGNHVLEARDNNPGGARAQTNLNVTSGGGCPGATLRVLPQTAPSGGTINLSGECYADTEDVSIIIDQNAQEIARPHTNGGHFTTSATVPSVSTGTHTLTARGVTSNVLASTQLTIDNGAAQDCAGGACFYNTTPTAGPGQQLALYGRGYDPGENIIVTADNGATVATATADGQGTFTTTGTVPQNLSPGQHQLIARGTRSGRSASSSVNVVNSYGQGSNSAYPPSAYQAPPGAGAPYPPGAYAAGPYGPGYGPYGGAPQAVRPPGAAPPAVTQAVGTSRIPFTGAKVRGLAFVAVSLVLGGLLLLSARAVLKPSRR